MRMVFVDEGGGYDDGVASENGLRAQAMIVEDDEDNGWHWFW